MVVVEEVAAAAGDTVMPIHGWEFWDTDTWDSWDSWSRYLLAVAVQLPFGKPVQMWEWMSSGRT